MLDMVADLEASNGDTFSRNNPPRIIFAIQASITSGFIVSVRIHLWEVCTGHHSSIYKTSKFYCELIVNFN